ncbi:MAG: S1C family serine protease [Gammaproteobacteria bacterium]|nr:S1C family serine protease [Gammaproteobacteria bacterium]
MVLREFVTRSRPPSCVVAWLLAALLCGLTANSVRAQGANVSAAADALRAVVALRAIVPRDSRTASFLGAQRTGTGLVIDDEGLILTIGYLVLEAEHAEVLVDEAVVQADVVAYDYRTGLGLVRARKAIDVPPLKLGTAKGLAESTPVLIAGFGGVKALRPAMVVSRREFVGAWEYLLDDAIYTSPPYPAFAGAALIGVAGELLGVGYLAVGNSASDDARLPGNMFVPIDILRPVLKQLVANGKSDGDRPWLGIFSERQADRIVVTRVLSEGPAEAAGIEVGDILLGVGETPVTTLQELYSLTWAHGDPGVTVPLVVYREGRIMNVPVRTGNRYQWFSSHPSHE